MQNVEVISSKGSPLVYVIRAGFAPQTTTFPTPPELTLQVGFVVYPEGGVIQRHTHLPLMRTLTGTAEVIVVREGRCALDVYDEEQNLVTTAELVTGDVMLMVGGGHGFRMLEPTVLLEVKQGPYIGIEEKERF